MGELILCSRTLAALPYYIEQASLNIYSLEELSYYIENNLYLLEMDLMRGELCNWIDKELRLTELAEKLREICLRQGTLAEFVTCILSQSGYCTKEKIRQIAAALEEMENKSEYECCKIKADRYVMNQRYVNAIYEYRRLLRMKEEKNEILVGNVWHNLGKAYACLFLFREAAASFKRAYELNQNPESLRECLYACLCMRDEKSFDRVAEKNNLTEEKIRQIRCDFSEMSMSEEIRQFQDHIEELFAAGEDQKIYALADEWKDTYRKNCRI